MRHRATTVLFGKIAKQRSRTEQDHLSVIPVNLRRVTFGMASQMHEVRELFQDFLKCFLLGERFVCEQRLNELLPSYRCGSLQLKAETLKRFEASHEGAVRLTRQRKAIRPK